MKKMIFAMSLIAASVLSGSPTPPDGGTGMRLACQMWGVVEEANKKFEEPSARTEWIDSRMEEIATGLEKKYDGWAIYDPYAEESEQEAPSAEDEARHRRIAEEFGLVAKEVEER